jgi:lipoprotein-anchoring transpeptidase ErfK/SrfK
MRALRTRHKLIAVVLAALLIALPALPAFAVGEPTITADITAAGTPLLGKTALEAREIIASAFAISMFDSLPIVADGRTFSLDADSALSLDVTASVDAAFAATEAGALLPVYVVDAPAVSAFVTGLAHKVDHAAVNSKRSMKHRVFRISVSSNGAKLDKTAALTKITAALVSEASGSGPATVTVPVTVLKPKITRANIGKTIVVALGLYRVRLYNGTKLEKSYSCAIGMRAYPTPRGIFKVVGKSAAPTWTNPYSKWSKGMPSHIHAGYYNPLGLRALYINSPGIRIHGTSKTYSMGHAASHGCIRLTNHNVVDIFPRVKVGTPVYIVK